MSTQTQLKTKTLVLSGPSFLGESPGSGLDAIQTEYRSLVHSGDRDRVVLGDGLMNLFMARLVGTPLLVRRETSHEGESGGVQYCNVLLSSNSTCHQLFVYWRSGPGGGVEMATWSIDNEVVRWSGSFIDDYIGYFLSEEYVTRAYAERIGLYEPASGSVLGGPTDHLIDIISVDDQIQHWIASFLEREESGKNGYWCHILAGGQVWRIRSLNRILLAEAVNSDGSMGGVPLRGGTSLQQSKLGLNRREAVHDEFGYIVPPGFDTKMRITAAWLEEES